MTSLAAASTTLALLAAGEVPAGAENELVVSQLRVDSIDQFWVLVQLVDNLGAAGLDEVVVWKTQLPSYSRC